MMNIIEACFFINSKTIKTSVLHDHSLADMIDSNPIVQFCVICEWKLVKTIISRDNIPLRLSSFVHVFMMGIAAQKY
mgnify:CR=1 FL=1